MGWDGIAGAWSKKNGGGREGRKEASLEYKPNTSGGEERDLEEERATTCTTPPATVFHSSNQPSRNLISGSSAQ